MNQLNNGTIRTNGFQIRVITFQSVNLSAVRKQLQGGKRDQVRMKSKRVDAWLVASSKWHNPREIYTRRDFTIESFFNYKFRVDMGNQLQFPNVLILRCRVFAWFDHCSIRWHNINAHAQWGGVPIGVANVCPE